MTLRLLQSQASADLDAILDYLEREAGPAVALKYVRSFDAVLERITDFPGIGSPRPELGPLARMAIVSPYLVIYDHNLIRDTVTVLRVLHGRRNITQEMLGR